MPPIVLRAWSALNEWCDGGPTPDRGEPPEPVRRRTVYVPVRIDEPFEIEAEARGLSYQAAVREAIAQLLETWKGPEQP